MTGLWGMLWKKNIYSTEELLSLIEKSPKNVEKMIENKEILNGIGGQSV